MDLEAVDLRFVEAAANLLERPNFAIKVSGYIGRPIGMLAAKLPDKAHAVINRAVEQALTTALRLAISTMRYDEPNRELASSTNATKWAHTLAAMGLGAGSGLVGSWALALELPVTTTLMMRSIASMAKAAGFNPSDPKTALEILTVFAYGSPVTSAGPASDTSFFVQRAALDVLIRDGASYIAGKSAGQVMTAIEGGLVPKLVELLGRVGSRMNVIVGEKFLAQSVPVLGAAGGAVINGMFNDYYSNIAYYAFGLKRLEQRYGEKAVRLAYEAAVEALPPA